MISKFNLLKNQGNVTYWYDIHLEDGTNHILSFNVTMEQLFVLDITKEFPDDLYDKLMQELDLYQMPFKTKEYHHELIRPL